MKLTLSLALSLCIFAIEIIAEDTKTLSRQNISILEGKLERDRAKYYELRRDRLKSSEFAILFMRSGGVIEKEMRFVRSEETPLEQKSQYDFDAKITNRQAFLSEEKKHVIVVENVMNYFSEKRLMDSPEVESQSGESLEGNEPEYVGYKVLVYDSFGNAVFQESNKNCNIRDDFGSMFEHNYHLRFSSSAKSIVTCLICNGESSEAPGCYLVFTPTSDRISLPASPYLPEFLSFSKNEKYLVFYSMSESIVFVDIESNTSSAVEYNAYKEGGVPEKLQAFDDGTFLVQGQGKKPVFYDIQANVVKKKDN